MKSPKQLDLETPPRGISRIIRGEEADIFLCSEPLELPHSAQPLDFHFDKIPPTSEPRVIKQFHTNYRESHITNRTSPRLRKVQIAQDLFGFVSPEGIQRLTGMYRLANVLIDHVVPVFGCLPADVDGNIPLLFKRPDAHGKKRGGLETNPTVRMYTGYVNLSDDDKEFTRQTYKAMSSHRQKISQAFEKVEGHTPDSNDLDFRAAQEAEQEFRRTVGEYERSMILKYKQPLVEALSEVASLGIGVASPGMNFGYALDPKDSTGKTGKIIFFELNSLVNYTRLIEVIREIKDSDKREVAGDILGEVIRLEEKALEKIIIWCDGGILGRNSPFGRTPDTQFGMIPFTLGNIPQKFLLDDGTLLRKWIGGLRNLLIENVEIIPKKPGDPEWVELGETLLLQPDHAVTHRREIEQVLQKNIS